MTETDTKRRDESSREPVPWALDEWKDAFRAELLSEGEL